MSITWNNQYSGTGRNARIFRRTGNCPDLYSLYRWVEDKIIRLFMEVLKLKSSKGFLNFFSPCQQVFVILSLSLILLAERNCKRQGFKGPDEQYFDQNKVQCQFNQLLELNSFPQALVHKKKKNTSSSETKIVPSQNITVNTTRAQEDCYNLEISNAT